MHIQGCFWGVEHYFNKHFKDAIIKSEVGYTGGEVKDPNYRQVCWHPAFAMTFACKACRKARCTFAGFGRFSGRVPWQIESCSVPYAVPAYLYKCCSFVFQTSSYASSDAYKRCLQVCSGATGHAEAVRFEYNPSKAKYEDLVRSLPLSLFQSPGHTLCCKRPVCPQ